MAPKAVNPVVLDKSRLSSSGTGLVTWWFELCITGHKTRDLQSTTTFAEPIVDVKNRTGYAQQNEPMKETGTATAEIVFHVEEWFASNSRRWCTCGFLLKHIDSNKINWKANLWQKWNCIVNSKFVKILQIAITVQWILWEIQTVQQLKTFPQAWRNWIYAILSHVQQTQRFQASRIKL